MNNILEASTGVFYIKMQDSWNVGKRSKNESEHGRNPRNAIFILMWILFLYNEFVNIVLLYNSDLKIYSL